MTVRSSIRAGAALAVRVVALAMSLVLEAGEVLDEAPCRLAASDLRQCIPPIVQAHVSALDQPRKEQVRLSFGSRQEARDPCERGAGFEAFAFHPEEQLQHLVE